MLVLLLLACSPARTPSMPEVADETSVDSGHDVEPDDTAPVDSGDPDPDEDPVDVQLWFSPNIGSRDFVDLFTRPEQWEEARGHVDVFQMYGTPIKAVEPAHCAMCGPNLRGALIEADAFRRLAEWDIELAVEDGVVKPGACLGAETAAGWLWTLAIVEEHGGTVARLTMDEPYRGGEMESGGATCGYTAAQSADQTAAWFEAVRAARPDVAIGEVEPYPYFGADELIAWLDLLDARGVQLDSFHLDVDLNALKNQTTATTILDLQALRDACAQRDLPFGIVVIGNEYAMAQSSDMPRTYYVTAMEWARFLAEHVGVTPHVVVQSWVDSSGGGEDGVQRVLPVNLAEGQPYTHTAIVNETWGLFAP